MNYQNRSEKHCRFTFQTLVVLALLSFSAAFAAAATRTWDGGAATSNWSDAANWSGDAVPTADDDVVFNSTSTKNSIVDQTFTVNTVSVNSGYTGTITQNAQLTVTNAFTQSAGTFQGAAANATFGSLNLSASAIFNAPSGTLTLNAQTYAFILQKDASATFNANGGTIEAKGALSYAPFGGSATFTFNNFTVSTGTLIYGAIVVNGTLTIGSGAYMSGGVPVKANGSVVIANDADAAQGSAEIQFSDTATRTATITGANITQPITINNPNITVTTGGAAGDTVDWKKKVALQAGTLQQSAANYVFSAGGGFNNPGFNVAGGTFHGSAGSAAFNTTVGLSNGSLNVGAGGFDITAASCANIYFQQTGGTFAGGAGNVKLCDARTSGGTFAAPSGDLTVLSYADFSSVTFTNNGGRLVIGNNVSVVASGKTFNRVALQGAGDHNLSGTPNPIINGTLDLTEGTMNGGGQVVLNGSVNYNANFRGGTKQLVFQDAATRTINLPASIYLLPMLLDNPNIAVTTSGAGASNINGALEVRRGAFQQGSAALTLGYNLSVAGGTFTGSSATLDFTGNCCEIIVSAGTLQGGTGAMAAQRFNTSGGVFSLGGDATVSNYLQTGGTFNASSGLLTVIADWTHAAGGAFNAGTGTVKFTGYNTFNCINSYTADVAGTETFNNLEIANSFCNARYVANGDTLIVNGDLRLSYPHIALGRIRANGTTTIDATANGYTGSTVVEYVKPNTNFVINNPGSVVPMLPVEMNANGSTLTSSGAGRINFGALNLINGTVNQGAGVWEIVNPGYSQSGGIFNGSQAEIFVANGTGNPLITGGTFNSGAGKVTGSFRMTGGTMNVAGDLDTSLFTLEGGTFNAPLGTMRFTGGNGNCFFTHTAASGIFNARTGTVEIQFGGCGFDVNARETFNNLVFRGGNFIAAGDALVVNGATVFNGGFANGGSIEANGDVQHLNGGTGNTNGNPNNGTTVLKFVDTTARTINFNTSNQTYATLAALVDNPNLTINFGTTATASAVVNAFALNRGTVNQGDGQAGFLNAYAQTGGTYNGGAAGGGNSPATNFAQDFTLTGGTFNAAPLTAFGANYTRAAGGAFNYVAGTVEFSAFGGLYNATIDADQIENFDNVIFRVPNGLYARTIAAGDTIIANGNLTIIGGGYVNGGTLEAKKDFTISGGFLGGSSNVVFSGNVDQTYTNGNNGSPTGTWTVNKPNSVPRLENNFAPEAVTTLFLSGNISNPLLGGQPFAPLNVVSGNVTQTAAFNHSLASLALAANTTFTNQFGGTLTLAGEVTNAGRINLDGNGAGCQADAVLLRSSAAGTQRAWNGAGTFRMVDVNVQDQAGSAFITVFSGTDAGNNGANFFFNQSCAAPTAGTVSVGGRATTARGRGIPRAIVTITDASGTARYATTNAQGYYSFAEVPVGRTYVLSIKHKTERFATPVQIVNIGEETSSVDFTAYEE